MTQPQHIRLFFMVATLFFSLALTACGASHSANSLVDGTSQTEDISTIDPNNPQDSETTTANTNFKLAVCSKLSFQNVSWPKSMDEFDKNAYALAMNITGSFEGSSGWNNIANNFDGQGVSLGLFNQNLGQGSLQPLLIRMREQHLTKMKSVLNTSQYSSLNGMLNKWQSSTGFTAKATIEPTENVWDSDFSSLDMPEVIEAEEGTSFSLMSKALGSTNQLSVNWATSQLYNGTRFIPEWKSSLQNLAKTPEYISQQLRAAEAIHKKASGYMSLGFRELRSYLFFFDIVVQNGGLSSSVQTKFKTWLKQNPQATETQRLTTLLNYRLTSVISQYVSDVRSRKMSIINGKGTVHGSARNYPKEFCVKNWNISITASQF